MNIKELRDVVTSSDASPFELQHSGVIGALLRFLTASKDSQQTSSASTSGGSTSSTKKGVQTRRRRTIEQRECDAEEAAAAAAVEDAANDDDAYDAELTASIESIKQNDRVRCFLHVFADLPVSSCLLL